MTPITNYGTILSDSDGKIGDVVSIDPPEFMNPAIESTNHSSGGKRAYVSSGLQEMAEFKCVINYEVADIASIVTDLKAGTKKPYTITYPNAHKQTFNAIATALKPQPADAMKPETLKAEITFQPSDSFDLSS